MENSLNILLKTIIHLLYQKKYSMMFKMKNSVAVIIDEKMQDVRPNIQSQ